MRSVIIRRWWWANAVLLAGVIALLALQRGRVHHLRQTQDALTQKLELQRAEVRARANRVAADEADRHAAERDNLHRLGAELVRLKQKADDRLRALQSRVREQPPVEQASEEENLKRADVWRNVGRASPKKTFETILWAARAGDLDVLSNGLQLSRRPEIEALMEEIPDSERALFKTPEHLVAGMLAKDVTEDSIQFQKESEIGEGMDRIQVQLNTLDKQKEVIFTTARTEDGWKLVVPPNVVEKYLKEIRGGATR